MQGLETELKIWQSLCVWGQGCDCHFSDNQFETQNKFWFVFGQEKLKLNTATFLSALSRLLARTLEKITQIWISLLEW